MQPTFIKIIKERKVIDGNLYRKYFIDSEGKEIGIPPYVYHTQLKGYLYVKVDAGKIKQAKFFSVFEQYHDVVTEERALKRCIAIVKNLLSNRHVTAPKPRKIIEKTCKSEYMGIDATELPTGVSFNKKHVSNNTLFNFSIYLFDSSKNKFHQKKIYVGTLQTWRTNYAKKLALAISLREKSLQEYNLLIATNHSRQTDHAA